MKRILLLLLLNASLFSGIVPEINGTNPQIQVNTGASATGYSFSLTANCSSITV